MHRRGTALNNVLWWQRCETLLVNMPDQQSRSVRDQSRISPTQPHDPALVSPRRSFDADKMPVSAPVLNQAEPVMITNLGAPEAALV
jgi:hypothetical protein